MKPRLADIVRRAKSASLPSLISLGAGTGGALALLGGFILPWFPLPTRAPPGASPAGGVITGVEAPSTAIWKGALVLLAMLCAATAWKWPARRRAVVSLGLAIGVALLLFYPCSLLYLAPSQTARAGWLEIQHSGLIWPGGDIFGSADSMNQEGRLHVKIVDIPRQVGAVKIPQSVPYLLDAGRLGEALEWLGYSDAFCLFAGKGWLLAIGGAVFLLASITRMGESADYAEMRLALKGFGLAVSLLCGLGLLPVFLTGYVVERAQQAVEDGNFLASKKWLRRAGVLMPVIRENSYFIIQMGLLDDKLNNATLEAAQFRAVRLEENGYHTQAESGFKAVLLQAPPDSALQQEAMRGLLRIAIRCLNGNENDHAQTLLETILHRDPINLKANVCLQFVCLRTQQLTELQDTLTSLRQIYHFIGTIGKIPVLAFCRDNEITVDFLEGNLEEALVLRSKNP